MIVFTSQLLVLSSSMFSAEISFNNYLLCTLIINIKVLKCHATKHGNFHKAVGKGRYGTILWPIRRATAVWLALPLHRLNLISSTMKQDFGITYLEHKGYMELRAVLREGTT